MKNKVVPSLDPMIRAAQAAGEKDMVQRLQRVKRDQKNSAIADTLNRLRHRHRLHELLK